MEQLGQYVLSLVAAAIICGVVLSLFGEGTIQKILRIICGIILVISAIKPINTFSLPDISVFSEEYIPNGEDMADIGKEMAAEERCKRIQQQLEAYILYKAKAYGAEVRPEVRLDEQGIPVEIWLHGKCSIGVRHALTAAITNDLGIPEEDQKWIGET